MKRSGGSAGPRKAGKVEQPLRDFLLPAAALSCELVFTEGGRFPNVVVTPAGTVLIVTGSVIALAVAIQYAEGWTILVAENSTSQCSHVFTCALRALESLFV